MTPDQIIQWAREAGLSGGTFVSVDALTRFATIARADMQEQCAQLANKQGTSNGQRLAEAIRALKD